MLSLRALALRGFWLVLLSSAVPGCSSNGADEEGEASQCRPVTLPAAPCDPSRAKFSLASTNPYYPLVPGSKTILEGVDEGVTVRVERTVLAETATIAGVTTHVLEARELKNGELYEVARNFYVEADDGTVCYFGEDVEFYEKGVVANTHGSWRAGVGGASPGIIMPAKPTAGQVYFQENAPGVAEDMGRVVSTDGTLAAGGTTYTGVVAVEDSNALEGCDGPEQKLYAPGVGEAGDTVKKIVSFVPGK